MTVPAGLVAVVPAVVAAVPLVVAAGPGPLVVVLLFPAGALLLAVAAVAAVGTGLSVTGCLLAAVVAAQVAAVGVAMRRWRRGDRVLSPHGSRPLPASWSSLTGAVAGAAVALLPLSRPALEWDARSIWLLHARLLAGGTAHYVDALHNPAYRFSHMDYPPLVPATVAAVWHTGGSRDYRAGQVTIALVGASLLAAVGYLAGSKVAAAVALERPRLRALSAVAGAVTAASVVVAAAGFAGPYLTDGYADVVAAGAAAAAAALLLTADTGWGTTAAGVGCLLAAGLTKDEGLVAALIISVALAARRWLADRRLRALALPSGLVAVLLVWPMVVLARGGPHGSILAGGGAPATGAGPDRLAATAHALAGRLELVPVLLAVTALAVLLRPRRAGGPVWLWVVLAADVLALAATYVLGKSPITWWLATSVDRVVILPQLLVLLIAASLVAVVLEARPRPGPAVRPSSRPESELVR